MDKRAIGIFDSGCGGLTVLTKLKETMPNENFIYLGDTLNFPYGPKTKEEIISCSIKNVEFLIEQDVKLIIIACGTATSQALDVLEEKYDIPIIGIIEPTVLYIKKLEIKEIGVIATEGTIRSKAWERKIKEAIPDIDVINKACPMLATIAEEGRAKSKEGRCVIKEYMKPFKDKKIQNIILGCTHYPIYEEIIKEELGYEVNLINTGETTAKFVKEFLTKKDIAANHEKQIEKIYLTKNTKEFKTIAQNILGENLALFVTL